jgi:hypothetical protein
MSDDALTRAVCGLDRMGRNQLAGLEPDVAFDKTCAYEFSDEATLRRGPRRGGGNRGPVGPERETEVQDAIATRLAHHLAADGSYRLQDEFRS